MQGSPIIGRALGLKLVKKYLPADTGLHKKWDFFRGLVCDPEGGKSGRISAQREVYRDIRRLDGGCSEEKFTAEKPEHES